MSYTLPRGRHAGTRGAAQPARRAALLARGHGHRLRGACRAPGRTVRGAGGPGRVRSRRRPRARTEPLPAQQRHRAGQPPGGRRAHAREPIDDGVPRDRAPRVRPHGRCLRRLDRHGAGIARTGSRQLHGWRDQERRADRPRRHRQGLRGRPDGRAARGVGPRSGACPRGLQLTARPRSAGGPRRVAAHAERPRRSLPGARPSLGAPDGARGIRIAKGRSHRGPASPASPPAGAARPGSRCLGRKGPGRRRGPTQGPGSRQPRWPTP